MRREWAQVVKGNAPAAPISLQQQGKFFQMVFEKLHKRIAFLHQDFGAKARIGLSDETLRIRKSYGGYENHFDGMVIWTHSTASC